MPGCRRSGVPSGHDYPRTESVRSLSICGPLAIYTPHTGTNACWPPPAPFLRLVVTISHVSRADVREFGHGLTNTRFKACTPLYLNLSLDPSPVDAARGARSCQGSGCNSTALPDSRVSVIRRRVSNKSSRHGKLLERQSGCAVAVVWCARMTRGTPKSPPTWS